MTSFKACVSIFEEAADYKTYNLTYLFLMAYNLPFPLLVLKILEGLLSGKIQVLTIWTYNKKVVGCRIYKKMYKTYKKNQR